MELILTQSSLQLLRDKVRSQNARLDEECVGTLNMFRSVEAQIAALKVQDQGLADEGG